MLEVKPLDSVASVPLIENLSGGFLPLVDASYVGGSHACLEI